MVVYTVISQNKHIGSHYGILTAITIAVKSLSLSIKQAKYVKLGHLITGKHAWFHLQLYMFCGNAEHAHNELLQSTAVASCSRIKNTRMTGPLESRLQAS